MKRGGFSSFSLSKPELKLSGVFPAEESRKRQKLGGDDYFDTSDGEEQPKSSAGPADEDVDPLDAFMAEINTEVKQNKTAPPKAKRADLEEMDPEESYYDHVKNSKPAMQTQIASSAGPGPGEADYNSDEEVYAAAKAMDDGTEYDGEDNVVVDPHKKKKIEALVPLEHSKIQYTDFEKCFYDETESPHIAVMSDAEVNECRRQMDIRVMGSDVPKPAKTFEQLPFDETLLAAIRKHQYEKPTPIQVQALPVILSGRDVIGLAKTGSGKTAAFLFPLLVHIMDQPELSKGDGPIGIICAPTRELAQQIHSEAKKFAKGYGIRVCAVYGGASKFEQFKELRQGAEIIVATPGRLIDMIKMKGTKMNRVTYLVLDEADRMFDMGFEPQVRSIVGQIRPDRQSKAE
mmetsp:Transcript_44756/g.74572  ORF Transcript_44756/g.74572 Transcript_44756/m.74572 type:complete len:403 (-) Transcript_44756:66-1274(-)